MIWYHIAKSAQHVRQYQNPGNLGYLMVAKDEVAYQLHVVCLDVAVKYGW